MIQGYLYGRLGRDPEQRTTQAGKPMAVASVAVDASGHNSEVEETVWFGVLCFGNSAEALLRHQKGDLVSLSGRVTQSRWVGKDGVEKTQLSILADTVLSARTVRPRGGKPKAQVTDRMQVPVAEYDDAMTF